MGKIEKLRASEIYRDSRFLLIAVESVSFQHHQMDQFSQISAKIEPVAIVVCGPKKSYALDMEAQALDLEKLQQNLPELDDIMACNNELKGERYL